MITKNIKGGCVLTDTERRYVQSGTISLIDDVICSIEFTDTKNDKYLLELEFYGIMSKRSTASELQFGENGIYHKIPQYRVIGDNSIVDVIMIETSDNDVVIKITG